MEPTDTNSEGGIAAVTAWLLLWCRRNVSGLLLAEFTDELARKCVVERVRSALLEEKIGFVEVRLPQGLGPTELVRDFLRTLAATPRGVVSVSNFPLAFPQDPKSLADALYAFNFNRENLAKTGHVQIWWMPSYFATIFERANPDLNSWFLTRLRLTELMLRESDATETRERELSRSVLPTAEARRQAGDLMARFSRGLANGLPPAELVETLAEPAARILVEGGLEREALEWKQRFHDEILKGEAYSRSIQHLQEPASSPASESERLLVKGKELLEKRRYAEAEAMLRQALAARESVGGSSDPGLPPILNELWRVLYRTGRFQEAEPVIRRALAIDGLNYGNDHHNVAIRLSNLAQLLQETNRLGEAELVMRQALEIDERSYGPDHPIVASDLNNLAALLRETNRLEEAESMMQRALAIDEQSYGHEHPIVAIRLSNLAALLQETNRLREAEPMMRRALAIDEKRYGHDHPNMAVGLNNLAVLLYATNRPEEAEHSIRRALAIDEHIYGQDHPSVAIRLSNLAALLQNTNRLDEAKPMMQRAVNIFVKRLGNEHPKTKEAKGELDLLLKRIDAEKSEKKTAPA